MNKAKQIIAEDLMQTEVITLEVGAPIAEAVQTFEECWIKGAPVVDAAGNPVGVSRHLTSRERGTYKAIASPSGAVTTT